MLLIHRGSRQDLVAKELLSASQYSSQEGEKEALEAEEGNTSNPYRDKARHSRRVYLPYLGIARLVVSYPSPPHGNRFILYISLGGDQACDVHHHFLSDERTIYLVVWDARNPENDLAVEVLIFHFPSI